MLKLIASDEQQITVQLSLSELHRIIIDLHHAVAWMEEDLKTIESPSARVKMVQEVEEIVRLMHRLDDLAESG